MQQTVQRDGAGDASGTALAPSGTDACDAQHLGRLTITRKTGAEPFHTAGKSAGFDLLDYWQWSTSDLVSNVTRGRLAEYIVARALGVPVDGVRDEWAAYDLKTPSGTKVEVKSAAYVQSWFQRALSRVSFLVPKTLAWDAATNRQAKEACRHADVYVFALLAHRDKSTIDALNLDQWRFYALPTSALDARTRSQHSITIKSLEALAGSAVTFADLRRAVDGMVGRHAAQA